jgi:DnaD/phage-associated family protein
MQFTSIPNLFFSTLLPQISDISELKTTLHIFEVLYRKRGYPRFTSYRELLSNKSLVSSLRETGQAPEEALRRSLKMAAERGAILHLIIDREGATEDIYFLNNEANKEIITKIQSGKLDLKGLKVEGKARIEIEAEELPDIFTLYEQNIGMLTPMIADELQEAEKLYPESWIKDAMKEAVSLNKRNIKYIIAILERWSAEGKTDGAYRRDSKKTGPNKYFKQKYGNIIRR